MENELSFNPSDSELFDDISESSPSLITSPRHLADRPAAPNISEWTVVHLKRALTEQNITFHRTNNKAKLFQLLTNSQQSSIQHHRTPRLLPGSQPRTHRSAMTSSRTQLNLPQQPSQRARSYQTQSLHFSLAFSPYLVPLHKQPEHMHPSIPASFLLLFFLTSLSLLHRL